MSEEKKTALEVNFNEYANKLAMLNEKINFLMDIRKAVAEAPRKGKTHMGFWEKIAAAVNANAYKESYDYWPVDLSRRIAEAIYTRVTDNYTKFSVHKDFYNVMFTDDVAEKIIADIDKRINTNEIEQKKVIFQLMHMKEFIERYNKICDELEELYEWYGGSKYSGPIMKMTYGGEVDLLSGTRRLE